MKQTKLALSAVMIVAVGLIGTNFVTGSEMTDQEKINAYVDSSSVYGHITIVHSDPDGNILAYAQTDNIVTNQGKDCMAERLFGGTAGSVCAAVSTTDQFNRIGLFSGATFVLEDTAALETPIIAAGLGLASGTVTTNTAAAGTGTTVVNGAMADIAKTFTATATQAVDGAGLYNAGDDALFAGQVFSSVTLNNLDTLAVTWTITLG